MISCLPSKLWSKASLRRSSTTSGALLCLTSGFFRLQTMSVVFLPCIRSRLGRFMEPKLALLVTAPLGPLLVILPMVVLMEISCRISFTSWLLISIYKTTTTVKTSSVLANTIRNSSKVLCKSRYTDEINTKVF